MRPDQYNSICKRSICIRLPSWNHYFHMNLYRPCSKNVQFYNNGHCPLDRYQPESQIGLSMGVPYLTLDSYTLKFKYGGNATACHAKLQRPKIWECLISLQIDTFYNCCMLITHLHVAHLHAVLNVVLLTLGGNPSTKKKKIIFKKLQTPFDMSIQSHQPRSFQLFAKMSFNFSCNC